MKKVMLFILCVMYILFILYKLCILYTPYILYLLYIMHTFYILYIQYILVSLISVPVSSPNIVPFMG